jgi:serine/threonine protein phosphatase PrpC
MGKGEITPILVSYPAELGDIYLVCSDGLSGFVAANEIRDSFTSGDLTAAVNSLIAKAYERGAPDNVTVIVGEISNQNHISQMFLGAAQ